MIVGKSDERRYPVVGKIKIGIKGVSGSGREIPKSIDYFRADSSFAEMFHKVYGDKPREIEIVFPPIPDGGSVDDIFNHFYRSYKGGAAGKPGRLFCFGNGKTAMRSDGKGNMVEGQKCPCSLLEEGKCSERLKLIFMIPKVPVVGVWMFETSSFNTRINIVSSISLTNVFAGNICGIPMKMTVEIQEGAVFGSPNKYPVVKIMPTASTEELLQLQGMDAGEVFRMLTNNGSKPTVAIEDRSEGKEYIEDEKEIVSEDKPPVDMKRKAELQRKRELSDTPFDQTDEEKELQREIDTASSSDDIDSMQKGTVINAILAEFKRLNMAPSYQKNSMNKNLMTDSFSEAKELDLKAYLGMLRERKE